MRLKSTAVWYDLPGVEAAYMPIGAPSAVDALMNVGHTDAQGNHRMAGRYTATPGTAPTWSAATGHTYNGTTQYLTTGIIPSPQGSLVVRFSNTTNHASVPRIPVGSGDTERFFVIPSLGNATFYGHGGYGSNTPGLLSGVLAVVAGAGYRNGIFDAILSAGTVSSRAITIGCSCQTSNGALNYWFPGSIQSILIALRTLTPAEVWLASRQMAYCEQNPDWNAWARRRRYYYAPSAAAFQASWAARTNRLIGGGL